MNHPVTHCLAERTYNLNQASRRYDLAHPERRKEQHRHFVVTHRDKVNADMRAYNAKHPEKLRQYRLATNKERTRKLKIAALTLVAKGKPIACEECGCDELVLLQINHIKGGGGREFRNLKSKNVAREVVMKRRDISDLNILCVLCNWAHYIKLKYGVSRHTIKWNKH
jgi:hypothetical protein